MRSIHGTKTAQLVRFSEACGLLEVMRGLLAEASIGDRSHVTTFLEDEGTTLCQGCGRCGAIHRLDLPRPVRCMLTPVGVPSGFPARVRAWKIEFWTAHVGCPIRTQVPEPLDRE